MAPERFPKTKYLRMLSTMEHDLLDWAQAYSLAAQTTQAEWLQGRFLDRAALLEEAAFRTGFVRDVLEGLPRLS